MLCEPFLGRFGTVGAAVVEHDMNRQIRVDRGLDLFHELDEVGRVVAGVARQRGDQ